jgi:hypothetical protein
VLPVRVLRFQSDYLCRNSGACCTTGWSIPVEASVEGGLREALRDGRLAVSDPASLLKPRAGLPDGATSVLGIDAHDRCRAFEPGRGNLCAIHRQLGPESLPATCRQFPRVALITPDAVSLTLSHFCPTAAALVFREEDWTGVVAAPPAFGPAASFEGLDARAGIPPLLRPDVLLGWEAHRLWEGHALARLETDDGPVEETLCRLRAQAQAAASWTAERGPFAPFLQETLAATPPRTRVRPPLGERVLLWREVVACVPEPYGHAAPPADLASAHGRLVAPEWPRFVRPLRRFLAAKAFASWCAVQGTHLLAAVSYLEAALAMVEVEAARAASRARRPLDAELLKQSFRRADRVLLHLAAPEALARRLSALAPPC